MALEPGSFKFGEKEGIRLRKLLQLLLDTVGKANLAGGNAFAGSQTTSMGFRATGIAFVSGMAGPGLESGYDGSKGYLTSYNRTTLAFLPTRIDGLTVTLQASNVDVATVSSNGLAVAGSVKFASYTVATVPSAAAHGAGAQIYVSNESGGALPAFSDGAAWRRVTDRAVIS